MEPKLPYVPYMTFRPLPPSLLVFQQRFSAEICASLTLHPPLHVTPRGFFVLQRLPSLLFYIEPIPCPQELPSPRPGVPPFLHYLSMNFIQTSALTHALLCASISLCAPLSHGSLKSWKGELIHFNPLRGIVQHTVWHLIWPGGGVWICNEGWFEKHKISFQLGRQKNQNMTSFSINEAITSRISVLWPQGRRRAAYPFSGMNPFGGISKGPEHQRTTSHPKGNYLSLLSCWP